MLRNEKTAAAASLEVGYETEPESGTREKTIS